PSVVASRLEEVWSIDPELSETEPSGSPSTPGIDSAGGGAEAVGADGVSGLVPMGAVSVGVVSIPASWAKAIAVGETMKLMERATAINFRSAISFRCQRRELRRIE